MFIQSYQIQCLNGGEGGIWAEKGGRGVVGRDGEIQYNFLFNILDKLN